MGNFGRLYAHDSRDARYPMRLLLGPLLEQFFPAGLPPGERRYPPGPVLNQGETGTCVAHAWAAWLASAPVMQSLRAALGITVFDLYRLLVAADEFADNDAEATAPDADLQMGTSGRAGAKVLQAKGIVTSYLNAESIVDVRACLLSGMGCVVTGVNYRTGMMVADSEGFLSVTGVVEGGHEFLLTGWSDHVRHNGRLVRATRMQNSWDRYWAQGGRAWIDEDGYAALLADQGDAIVGVQRRVQPLPPPASTAV